MRVGGRLGGEDCRAIGGAVRGGCGVVGLDYGGYRLPVWRAICILLGECRAAADGICGICPEF